MKWVIIHIAEMHLLRIWGTDVCVASCTFYPSTHGRHRNARSLLTIQDKRLLSGWREGVVGGDLDEKFSLQLLLLCCTNPGDTVTAVEGGHIMIYHLKRPWPKTPNTADENRTHCSKTMRKTHKSLRQPSQSCAISLFISQDDCMIYWCAAKAS